MATKILNAICNSCNCDQQQAQEYLDDEIRHLNDLSSLGDLIYSDLEDSCSNLGLDYDYVEYFIYTLALVSIPYEIDYDDEEDEEDEELVKEESANY